MSEQDDILSEFTGLDERSLQTYSLVLALGHVTKGDIALMMKIEVEEVDAVLSKLEELQMIVTLPGIVPRYQAVPPFDKLAESIGSVTERIEQVRKELKQQLKTASIAVKEALVDLARTNLERIKSLDSEFETSRTESIGAVSTTIEEGTRTSTELSTRFETEMQSSLEGWKTTSTERIEATFDGIRSELSSSNKAITSDLKSWSSSTRDSSERLKSDLVSHVDKFEKNAESLLASQPKLALDKIAARFDTVSSDLRRTDKELGAQFENLSQATSDIASSLTSGITDTVTTSKDSMNRILDDTMTSVVEELDSFRQSAMISIEESRLSEETRFSEFEIAIDGIAQRFADSQQSVRDNLDSSFAEVNAKLMEMIKLAFSSISDEINGLAEQSHVQLDDAMTSMNAYTSTAIQDITESIKSAFNKVMENVTAFMNQTQGTLFDQVDTITNRSTSVLETKLSDLSESTLSRISTMKANSMEIISGLETGVSNSINAGRAESRQAVENLSIASSTAVENLRQTTSELITTAKVDLQQASESLSSSADSYIARTQTQIQEETSSTIQTLGESLEGIQSKAQSEIDGFKETGRTSLAASSNQVSQSTQSAISELKDTFDGLKNGISGAISELKGGLVDHSSKMKGQLSDVVNRFSNELETSTDSGIARIDSAFTTSESRIDTLSGTVKDTTIEIAESFLESSVQEVKTLGAETSAGLNQLKTKLAETVNSGFSSITDSTFSVKEALNRLLTKLDESPMLALTDETLEKAFEGAVIDDAEGSNIGELLTTVWDKLSSTDFPGAKKFWSIATRGAVLAHVNDMIGRAKSKVTLIVPSPVDIPTKILSKVKSSLGIELVVTEGARLDAKIKPLVGRGNIRVRTRSDSDVFACVRDGEEILLAPVTMDDRDVIGIVSEDDGFVKFVMGIVGPIFQAKAKLVRPEDFTG